MMIYLEKFGDPNLRIFMDMSNNGSQTAMPAIINTSSPLKKSNIKNPD